MSRAIGLAQWLEAYHIDTTFCKPNHSPFIESAAAELRRLDAETVRLAAQLAEEKLRADRMTEQHRMQAEMCAKVQEELAAIRALEPVAWAYVDMWKAQEDPVDDCFFIYDRKGTTPLYALPEQK